MSTVCRWALTLCLAGSLATFGQSLSSLTGTVVDPTGAAVPDASLTLLSVESSTLREVRTDAQGRYLFAGVKPGEYRLTAKKSGFADVSVQKVQLLVNTPGTLNITFETVGSVAQTVEVSAEGVQLNTSDASLGNVIDGKAITQLPLEGRSVERLLSLQPGFSWIGDPDTVNGGSNVATDRNGVVNGGRSDQSNMTLDGVDINNQQTRNVFAGALRVTLDSVQEFRVTTSNANADSSRGSGAQVSMITRSGTNEIHGAGYWYVRNKMFNANTFFNNQIGLSTPKLNRNIFGGRIGGPIKKNKLFYFFNYEGRQDRFEESAIRTVPRESLKNGIVSYLSVGSGIQQVQPAELVNRIAGAGSINQNSLNYLKSFPVANDFTTGDGLNTAGYRFNAARKSRFNTYVAKFDYNLNANNRLFFRGQLQNDNEAGSPQFPGAPSNATELNNSKGIAAGWDSTISPTLLSSTRYGFTRQGVETAGIAVYPFATFRGVDSLVGTTRPFRRFSPVNNFTQEFTWLKDSHTVQFGGSFRLYNNDRSNYANSFFGISGNSSWLTTSGQVLSAPWTDAALGNNRIQAGSRTSFNDATNAVLGLVTQVTSRYNYLPSGSGIVPQAPGSAVLRNFEGKETELYLQDSFKVKRNLTVVAGVRYMYWPPIFEKNGVQTNPNIPLSDWFDFRRGAAESGLSGTGPQGGPPISYVLSSGAGGRPFYKAFHNLSPRLAMTYSPTASSGIGRFLFGGADKTVIRAGWGVYYDVIGSGLARDFDASALGLSTSINNSSGRLTVAEAPRFTAINAIPPSLVTPAPAASFPVLQPNVFQITNSLDEKLAAPTVQRWNVSVSREFRGGWVVTGAYVGSRGRKTLTSMDMATPLNIRDPQSGMDYFTAAKALTRLIQSNASTSSVGRIPFWENMFPGLAGGGLSATQVAYNLYSDFYPDATGALENMDRFGDPSPSKLGRFAFYSPQYSYLRALRSVGQSDYQSMQWTVQKRFANGNQFGFNYTWAHSIDMGSTSEDNATAGRGIIINPYNPRQSRGTSDFDQRHAWNLTYLYNLPIGRGKRFGGGMNRFADLIVGGWQLSGIYRQSTGLPVGVGHNRTWPTNYNWTGNATQNAQVADGTNKNAAGPNGGQSGPNIFQDPNAAFKAFGFTMPGEIGDRNNLRGDGIFTIDVNVAKNFAITERQYLQFRWETFNVTNSVRFDPLNINLSLSNPSAFGRYAGTLGGPRVMQFALRYEF